MNKSKVHYRLYLKMLCDITFFLKLGQRLAQHTFYLCFIMIVFPTTASYYTPRYKEASEIKCLAQRYNMLTLPGLEPANTQAHVFYSQPLGCYDLIKVVIELHVNDVDLYYHESLW